MEQNKECWGRILKVVYDKDDTCGVLKLSFLPSAMKFRIMVFDRYHKLFSANNSKDISNLLNQFPLA